MKQTARGRISVDIGRLRVALFERARAEGVSPSHLVRDIVARELTGSADTSVDGVSKSLPDGLQRVRISLRLSPVDALRLQRTAHRTGKSLGDLVAELFDGMPAPVSAVERQAHLRALVVSNSEMASLSRDLRQLSALLGQGSVAAAHRYRDLLDAVASDVRRHVDISSVVLRGLAPVRRLTKAAKLRKAP